MMTLIDAAFQYLAAGNQIEQFLMRAVIMGHAEDNEMFAIDWIAGKI